MVLVLGRTLRCYWIFIWFSKLILHHPRAVTAASHGSTIADLTLTTTLQYEPCIPWSRLSHILPCHTLIPIVWALVFAEALPVRSPAKASAILNESVTAVTASRFSPWLTRKATYMQNRALSLQFVIMSAMVSQITSLTIVYSAVYPSWVNRWIPCTNGQ